MGLILFAAMFAGGALGLIVTAFFGGVGVVLTSRNARQRTRVWGTFAVMFAIGLTLCILAVHFFPYAAVRPGSDYDVAMKNMFLQALGYCGSPGLAALAAALATLLMPKKQTSATVQPFAGTKH